APLPESGVARDCRSEARTLARRAARRYALPVRAPGLLLRGSGLDARTPGLQPDGHAEGHLGEDRGTGAGLIGSGPAIVPVSSFQFPVSRGPCITPRPRCTAGPTPPT